MTKSSIPMKLTLLGLLAMLMSCARAPVQSVSEEKTARPSGESEEPAASILRTDPRHYTQEELDQARFNTEKAWKNTSAMAEHHFGLAQAYSADGNVDRAIEEYRLTLVFDPQSALVHTRLAAEYIKKGMLSGAMESCKAALKADPGFTDARLILAGLYSTIQDQEAALREYETILKEDPSHEEAAIFKAQVLVEEGRVEEAASFLTSYLRRNGESIGAWYYLGRTEQLLDRFKPAEKAYRTALKLHSGFYQAAHALAFLYESKNMTQKALSIYKNLYEERQDRVAADRLATVLLKQEKFTEALPYLEALRAIDPENLNAQVKLGLTQMELRKFDQAIETFKRILEKTPDSDRVHYYLGSVYEQVQNHEDAIRHLRKIGPESRLYENAALHVTFLLKETGKRDRAIQYIAESIQASPKTASFYIFQASLEEDENNLGKAVEVLEKAVDHFPEHEKIRYYLGSLYDKQGRVEDSLREMETILVHNPDNPDALNYIGYTWTVQGVHLEKAEQMIRKALSFRPDNGYIIDSLGWNQFVRGRYHEAIILLEQAARLNPNEATILEHLGDAYAKANLRGKALAQYEKALEFAPTDLKNKLSKKIENLRSEFARSGSDEKERLPASR